MYQIDPLESYYSPANVTKTVFENIKTELAVTYPGVTFTYEEHILAATYVVVTEGGGMQSGNRLVGTPLPDSEYFLSIKFTADKLKSEVMPSRPTPVDYKDTTGYTNGIEEIVLSPGSITYYTDVVRKANFDDVLAACRLHNATMTEDQLIDLHVSEPSGGYHYNRSVVASVTNRSETVDKVVDGDNVTVEMQLLHNQANSNMVTVRSDLAVLFPK